MPFESLSIAFPDEPTEFSVLGIDSLIFEQETSTITAKNNKTKKLFLSIQFGITCF